MLSYVLFGTLDILVSRIVLLFKVIPWYTNLICLSGFKYLVQLPSLLETDTSELRIVLVERNVMLTFIPSLPVDNPYPKQIIVEVQIPGSFFTIFTIFIYKKTYI